MKPRNLANLILPFALAAVSMALACSPTDDDPLACREGTCLHQDELTFCDIDGVYAGSSLPNECIAPPTDDACNRAVECTSATRPYCTDDSMGACVECTENSHCEDDESCDTRVGECTDEVILTCTPGAAGDAQCALEGVGLDYCGDGDICVACIVNDHCTTSAAEAICDETLFTCRGCEDNAECASGLCGTSEEGVCVDEGDVVYVGGSGAADGAGCGTLAAPCATIGAGIGAVAGSRNVVLVAAGTYSEQLNITDVSASLVAGGAVIVNPGLGSEENALRVRGVSDISLDGFAIEAGANLAGTSLVSCLGADASLSIHNSTIRGSQGLGIEVSNQCSFTLNDSTVSGNDDGGIDIDDANYSVVNNFITKNGDTGTVVGGLRISGTNDRTEKLEFNTISHNVKADAIGYALACSAANLEAKNNILMLDPATVGGLVSICNSDFSLIDTRTETNTGTHTNPLSANADFVDAPNGDFHLSAGSPGIDAADPAATLLFDFDGDARPTGMADMGADEFVSP